MRDAKPPAHPAGRFARTDRQMIVEPASIHSRSPLRRLLRAAAFVAPVALLATVLAAGLLGSKSAQDAGVDASASALAAVSPSAAPTRVPSPAPSLTTLAAPPATADAAFPATVASLPAIRPSTVLAERVSPRGATGVYAVTGYLAITGAPTACAAPSTAADWCTRTGLLFESAKAGGIDASGGRPPHLHVTIPAGVVLPGAVTAGGQGAAGSVPVVAVGRFDATGSCAADPQSCDHGFVVERVVWADGQETGLQLLREPGERARAVDPVRPPMGQDVLTLVAVLAKPATVARLDPQAGAVAVQLKTSPRVVWYVRRLVGIGSAPAVVWALLVPSTGEQLASGVSPLPPLTALAPGGSPSTVPQG